MTTNPYVGPRSFETGEALYGRDRELRTLSALLIAERIVLLHSPSGAGKTSLLKAGLLPQLVEEDFNVLPMVRVNIEPPAGITANRYLFSTLLSLEEGFPAEERLPLAELATLSLDGYLTKRAPEDNTLLVFDQFEEILTISAADRDGKLAFFTQLGAALRNKKRWALFSMREDYLGALAVYARPIPNRLATRFRLDLLGAEAASQAIQKPAKSAGVDFTTSAAQKLVDDLRRVQVQLPDGSLETQLGPYVEPVQLQVVCFRLWEGKAPDDLVLDEHDLASVGDVNQSLAEYYALSVSKVAQASSVTERSIREWFEHKLITPEGIRGQVRMGAELSDGLPNPAVRSLEDAHIIRAEQRAGQTWYELAHDRLIEPVRADNRGWFSVHLSLFQQQAVLWVQQGKSDGLLLRGKELEKAEAEAKALNLTRDEETFLAACRKLKEREDRDRRRNRLMTILAIGATIATLVAGFFWLQAQKTAAQNKMLADENAIVAVTAQAAKNEALTQKAAAVQAQKTAEASETDARKQEKIARAGQLAAQSVALRNRNFPVSLLLGIESFKLLDNAQTRGALLDNVQANPRLRQYLNGHHGTVTSVAFSPLDNGGIFASASCGKYDDYNKCLEGEIILWDMESHQSIGQPLSGHTDIVTSLAFSPDGKTLASGSGDKTILLWDVQRRQPIGQPLSGHAGKIASVAFSPDGSTLASGSCAKQDEYGCLEGEIMLWAVESRQPIGQPFSTHTDIVASVAFSPLDGGKILASGSSDGAIILWDVQSRQSIGQMSSKYSVYNLAFSPDGQSLASASCARYAQNGFCVQGEIILWDVESQQPIGQPLNGHSDYVTSLAFSPDGKTLASGSWDSTILLWDVSSHQPIGKPLSGHNYAVTSVAFSPNGKTLASGSWDKSVALWDLENHQPISQPLSGHKIYAIAYSSDGKTLASGSENNKIILWNAQSRQAIGEPLVGHKDGVTGLAFSPVDGGKILASGSHDRTVILWNVESHQPIDPPLSGHSDYITSVAFSPNGKILASGSWDKTIILWDVARHQIIGKPLSGHYGNVTSVAFSPDGGTLVSGSCAKYDEKENCLRGEIILWDVESQQPIGQPLSGHYDVVNNVAFSPDGKTLASGSWDKTIILWDVASQQPIGQPLAGHTDYIFSVAFSPDGKTLASAGSDRTIILWDVQSRQPIGQPFTEHTDAVVGVAFSSDGKTLASGSWDNTILLWDLDPQSWLQKTCLRLGRNFTQAEWKQYFPGEDYRLTCSQWPTGN